MQIFGTGIETKVFVGIIVLADLLTFLALGNLNGAFSSVFWWSYSLPVFGALDSNLNSILSVISMGMLDLPNQLFLFLYNLLKLNMVYIQGIFALSNLGTNKLQWRLG